MSRSGNLSITNDRLIFELLEDPDYDVREDGTVWTLIAQTGKRSVRGVWRLAGFLENSGYYRMKYKRVQLSIHRIVFAKFGNIPLEPDLVVNHINSLRGDNRPSNLELITQSENNIHAFKSGKKPVLGNKKINQEIAEEIRSLRASGAKLKTLSSIYGIGMGNISAIVNNKIWKSSVDEDQPEINQVKIIAQ